VTDWLALTDFLELEAVVWTKWYTPAAVNAHKWLADMIEEHGVDWTGFRALATPDAKVLLDQYSPTLSLGKRPGGARFCTGCGITGQTGCCLVAC
jgi:hypothetical protein